MTAAERGPAGGVTIVTSNDGVGGQPIGSAVLDPGQSHLDFGWQVNASQSIPASQAREQLESLTRI